MPPICSQYHQNNTTTTTKTLRDILYNLREEENKLCGYQIAKKPHFITERIQKPFLIRKSSVPPFQSDGCTSSSSQLSVLPILPMSVKVLIEIADTFVKVVQVIKEHSISNHFLLPDTTLQFVPLPASKPYGALD